MPSDLDRAVKASKALEAALRTRHNAQGRGLHELVDSVEGNLPARAVRDLRYVATLRNKLVHEDGYDRLDDRREFARRVARANKAVGVRQGFSANTVIAVAAAAFVIGAGVAIWLMVR